jgi:hypothetical protein
MVATSKHRLDLRWLLNVGVSMTMRVGGLVLKAHLGDLMHELPALHHKKVHGALPDHHRPQSNTNFTVGLHVGRLGWHHLVPPAGVFMEQVVQLQRWEGLHALQSQPILAVCDRPLDRWKVVHLDLVLEGVSLYLQCDYFLRRVVRLTLPDGVLIYHKAVW